MYKKVVYVPGVWDMLHIGHLNILKRAALLGDYLIVGVCSDRLNIETKGDPVINENWRAELINSIGIVDEVYIYDDQDQTDALGLLRVDVFAVGEEFGYNENHKRSLDYCMKNDIDVVKIKRFPGISTSVIKEKIKLNKS